MAVLNPFDFFLEPEAEKFPFAYDPALDHELAPFQRKCWLTPRSQISHRIRSLLGRTWPQEKSGWKSRRKPRTNDFLVAINQRLWKDIKYIIRLEPGVQTPEETLAKAAARAAIPRGCCASCCATCGLAARFVSGYLIQLKPDVKSLDGPSGAEKDFTDLHAWCEVYLPGARLDRA